MPYEITFAKRSARTSITGQPGQEGPFEQTQETMSAMIGAFKVLAADPDVTMLVARGADGALIGDRELYRLAGVTGR